jgi:4-amino-4-deoxy-L-arabinose transferase-like glycosyltransferase
MAKMTLSTRSWALIFLFLQAILTFGYELSHDEAYYWLFSKNLDWGFFDHPPFVAAIIKLFGFLPKSEFTVRIGFLFLQYLSIEILLKLLPVKSHNIAFLLFLTFPLASFGGLFALPDMPLLFMTVVYCYCLKEFLEEKKNGVWKLGLAIPLLLYAKYHGILLIFFTIVAIPKLVFRKNFWLVAFLSVLFFLPHVYWQYEHEFSTLRYHFLERPKAVFSIKRLWEYLGVQIFLAGFLAGPIVWWTALERKSDSEFNRSLKIICIGVVIFFFLSSFSKKFEANWTIFLTIPLVYLSATSEIWMKNWSRILVYISVLVILPARLILIVPVEYGPKRLKEFHGWKTWVHKIQQKCGNRKILANTYQLASKFSFYLDENIHALNLRSRKNQFDYWEFSKEYSTKELCYVTDKIEFTSESIQTPEGKIVKIVTNQYLHGLIEEKRKAE